MSAPIPTFLYGAVPLNDSGLVASWRRGNPESDSKGSKYPPVLNIISAAHVDEEVLFPAASITIFDREGLRALRDAIDQALAEGGAA